MAEGACADLRERWLYCYPDETDPHPSLSRKRARVTKKQTRPGLFTIETFPRLFRWERDRVRVISLFVPEVDQEITSWSIECDEFT
jgi:hypothetical protein